MAVQEVPEALLVKAGDLRPSAVVHPPLLHVADGLPALLFVEAELDELEEDEAAHLALLDGTGQDLDGLFGATGFLLTVCK